MQQDYFQKKINSGEKLLSRWRGDYIKLAEITWAGANVIVEEEGKEGHLLICCVDPVEIHGVTKVKKGSLSITHDGKMFIVADEANNFKVLCYDIEFKEKLNP